MRASRTVQSGTHRETTHRRAEGKIRKHKGHLERFSAVPNEFFSTF